MRRLTLILSDLYLPEEVTDDTASGVQPLPGFESLLRFADAQPVQDWRRWLTRELGVPELGELPIAEVAGRAWLPLGAHGSTWLATPLQLSARLDHVRLEERGLVRIGAQEGGAWSMEFAAHFAPRLRLHAAGERGFVLTGMDPGPAITLDPARLLGSDIGDALPRGTGSSDLRRLGAEVEMWLHGSSLNASRAQEGRPRISALWFWGGGAQDRGLLPGILPQLAAVRLHGKDPFLAGLAVTIGSGLPAPAPDHFARLDPGAEHHVVEFAPMTGESYESLASLDSNWFLAARHALGSGALAQLTIVANDRCFRLERRSHWKLWRARRRWLGNLARSARNPKA
jgi:hypothetical protein